MLPSTRSIIILLVIFSATACEDSNKAEPQIRTDAYFKNSVARYIVDEQRYDVPMGYKWWARIKYNQWPTPKNTYTDTTTFEIFALLPDMLPYSSATKEKFDNKQGKGDIVNIIIRSAHTPMNDLNEIIHGMVESGNLRSMKQNKVIPELKRYGLFNSYKNRFEEEHYIPIGPDSGKLKIRCTITAKYPGCQLTEYQVAQGRPLLEISFSMAYLPQWKKIYKDSANLVDKLKAR